MTLNRDLIRARFHDIQQALDRLEAIRALSLEAFLADQDVRDVAHYRLLMAIEAALHVCYHVCARRLHRVPDDYAGCFGLLSDAGLLSPDLSQNLQRMARFRNVLVHVYWDIDESRVHAILQSSLDDLQAFVTEMGALL